MLLGQFAHCYSECRQTFDFPKQKRRLALRLRDSQIQIRTVRPVSASTGACNRERCKFSIHTIVRTYA